MQSITAAAAVGTANQATPQPRLVQSAHEFEAQMMKELMKPMTHDSSLTGEDEDTNADSDSESGSGGALGEFASEALGKALSEHGGFGIASSIIKELSHSGNHGGNVPVTGNIHGNTVISSIK
jgi:Rod binding domain-containing protein